MRSFFFPFHFPLLLVFGVFVHIYFVQLSTSIGIFARIILDAVFFPFSTVSHPLNIIAYSQHIRNECDNEHNKLNKYLQMVFDCANEYDSVLSFLGLLKINFIIQLNVHRILFQTTIFLELNVLIIFFPIIFII